MNIRQFTIADLEQSLRDNSLWRGDVVPITKHRAMAQICNPRADATDVALLVAYDGERMVGHLGILPDKLFVGDRVHKIGWLTAWWADPSPKYAALGLMLLVKALHAWTENLGVSGFAVSARKFYDASKKFVVIKEPVGVVGVVRCNLHDFVPRRWPRLRPLRFALRLIDALVNPFVALRLRFWARRSARDVAFRAVNTIDEETQRFIASHQQNELTRRGPAELDWIRRHPWVLAEPVSDAAGEYHFSSVARRFVFVSVEVRDATGRLAGFLLLNLHNGRLSVPFCCCAPADADQVASVVARQAIALKASHLAVFNPDLIRGLARIGFPFLYQQATERPWIISAKFKDVDFGPYNLQDGDGDCAFT